MVIVEAITHMIDNVVFQPVIFSNSVKAHPLEIFMVVLAPDLLPEFRNDIRDTCLYRYESFCREFFYNFKAGTEDHLQAFQSSCKIMTAKESAEKETVLNQNFVI